MGVEEKSHLDMNRVLKNALHWKQWMADDFRILIELSEQKGGDKRALHTLIVHHLQTYQLVNQTYDFITGGDDEKLFDLPNIEKLQEILPTLDLAKVFSEGIIEPMLELELDELSEELHEEALVVDFRDEAVEESIDEDEFFEEDADIEITVEDEGSIISDSDEDDHFVDDIDVIDDVDDEEVFDEDKYLDDEVIEQPDSDLTNSKTNETTSDIVSRLWGDLSSKALVNNEVNEGDVDVDEGRYE